MDLPAFLILVALPLGAFGFFFFGVHRSKDTYR